MSGLEEFLEDRSRSHKQEQFSKIIFQEHLEQTVDDG